MSFNPLHKNNNHSIDTNFLECGAFMALNEDQWVIGWGACRWSQTPDKTGFSFYVPDFFISTNSPWLLFEKSAIVSRVNFQGLINSWRVVGDSNGQNKLSWQDPLKSDFENQFSLIQKKFKNCELVKAVPIVFAKTDLVVTAVEKVHWMKRLFKTEGLHPFGFWTGEEGAMGVTPELLFDFNQRSMRLSSMALAGTGPLDKDLTGDPKEIVEHEWVLSEVEEVLSSLGQLEKSKTYEWKIPPLKHLRTDFQLLVTQPGETFENWVGRLHPTPALGVAPHRTKWHWLFDLNYRNRDGKTPMRHGAPFGVLTPEGNIKCLVAIRQIQWNSRELYLGSGCGVVPESQLESEWRELKLKQRAVQEVFGL